MARYIELDHLLAEMERRLEEYRTYPDYQIDSNYMELCEILSFINTLEVKEIGVDLGDPKGDKSAKYIIDTKNLKVKGVDLEKELKYYCSNYYNCDYPKQLEEGTCSKVMPHIVSAAKHFFELGLKARKGEIWKVVDNVNHPQADRNKIYCVFTKQQYILATVINHPQDEDLLQWKCTEFPFHRYDMCEGDKYMQIV